ncbi:hypothetical protein [Anaeromassilibacillus sp. SJQ-1]|uniref:hypothetical protein n=1 Tax=Anaeromassilibacillus sp. SJQ-1 TaxID=3375419 RepID=UPI0039895747
MEGTKGKVAGTSKGKLGAFDRPDAGEGILGKGTWTGGFLDGEVFMARRFGQGASQMKGFHGDKDFGYEAL